MEKINKQECRECGCNVGVCCEVKNCVYHDGTKNCKADTIHVGPQFAVSGHDTACGTFRAK